MSPKNSCYCFKVELQDAGKRVDKFLADMMPNFSRTKIKCLIENGALKLNNKLFNDCSHKVNIDDLIELSARMETNESLLSPKAIDLNIVYEDEYLMVIDKPSGLTVHPGAGNRDNTLANGLLHYLGDKLLEAGDAARPGIVHRLDKDTSGLMLVAKTSSAHAKLSKMIADKEVTRIYHTFVYSAPPQKTGVIKTQIGRSKRMPKKRTVLRTGGKTAVTKYKLISSLNGQISLVECQLETGRTHQIRVHMDYIGCPLIGDQTYGRDKNFSLSSLDVESKEFIKNFKRQALHSKRIEFEHPFTNARLAFDSGYPKDMEIFCKLFQNIT